VCLFNARILDPDIFFAMNATINCRVIIDACFDPADLLVTAVRARRSSRGSEITDEEVASRPDLDLLAEPHCGIGARLSKYGLARGAHIEFHCGLMVDSIPSDPSYTMEYMPGLYCDAARQGSLVTFINERVFDPNCTAHVGVYHGHMVLQIVSAGS
jgi:hypothetical protein